MKAIKDRPIVDIHDNGTSFSEDEEKAIKEGLDLFCKHFRNLWD